MWLCNRRGKVWVSLTPEECAILIEPVGMCMRASRTPHQFKAWQDIHSRIMLRTSKAMLSHRDYQFLIAKFNIRPFVEARRKYERPPKAKPITAKPSTRKRREVLREAKLARMNPSEALAAINERLRIKGIYLPAKRKRALKAFRDRLISTQNQLSGK